MMSSIVDLKRIHTEKVKNVEFLLERLDNERIPSVKEEIRLFVMARNEELRLPYFLKYYLENGVDRIFIIDNDSSDSTVNIALSYDKVHVFNIKQDFKSNFDYWMEYMLETYGLNHWCVVVDVDELFVYPFKENISIRDLTSYCDFYKYTAVKSLLVDVYSDKDVGDTLYKPGTDPLKTCPFLDVEYFGVKAKCFDKKKWSHIDFEFYFGGMRRRVFMNDSNKLQFCLSKVPILKYTKNTYLTPGMHAINGAKIADVSGCVMHTKFMFDFLEEAEIESKRGQHYADACEYKMYFGKITHEGSNLNLFDSKSVRFTNSLQLVELNLMQTSENYIKFLFGEDFLD